MTHEYPMSLVEIQLCRFTKVIGLVTHALRAATLAMYPALKISASPFGGERIEVRGFVNYSLRRTPHLTLSLGKGEANTHSSCCEMSRDPSEERARKLAN